MGPAPEKAGRIYGRDTQTTCPDPWSIHKLTGDETCRMGLGSDSSVSKKDAKLGFVVNYTNLLLIPGSLNNVMEEPAVELPLLDEPGIRTSIGRLDISGLYSRSR